MFNFITDPNEHCFAAQYWVWRVTPNDPESYILVDYEEFEELICPGI